MSRDDAGVIAIVVALFAVVLFGFAALVVDVGSAADVKAQAAAAADAGALAGVRTLASMANTNPPTATPDLEKAVYDAVIGAVALNLHYQGQGWASCKDPSVPADFTALSSTECIQYKVVTDGSTVTSSTVRVRIPTRKVQATFGGLFGVSSISVSPVAAAQAGQDPRPLCEPCDPKLDSNGQPIPPLPSYVLEPPDTDSTQPVQVPDPTGCPTVPGQYEGAVTTTTPCTMGSGIYVFTGKLTVGSGGLQGTDVTLMFTAAGTLDVSGRIQLTALDSGPTQDLAILFESPKPLPTDPALAKSFELGDNFDIKGNLYALAGTVWHDDPGDCPVDGQCQLNGNGSGISVLAVSATDFSKDKPSDPAKRIPTVHTTPERPLPPPSPEHLVE